MLIKECEILLFDSNTNNIPVADLADLLNEPNNISSQGVIYAGILAISYAGATLLFTFVEQPVTFFERLTYRN